MDNVIGYNVGKINELLEKIRDSYKQIKDAMTEPWDELSSVMRAEWVGEDEYANEKTLSNHLGELYTACSEAVNGVVKAVFNIGDAWRQFQSKNTLEGGVSAGLGNIQKITEIQMQSDTISLFKEASSHININDNLGLQNGLASATKVDTALQTYADTVYKGVEKLYQDLDDSAKASFLGENQSTKMVDYLHKMGAAIAKLTTCFKSIKEALNEAAKAYQTQATTTADAISNADTNLDTDQAVANGSGASGVSNGGGGGHPTM